MTLTRPSLVFAVLLLGACASVPEESVELSAAVGQDLETLHTAHKELAIRYFQRMHHDVDEFVDEVYRPYVIRKTMEDLNLLDQIEAAMQPSADLDPLDVMEIYVEEAITQIESYRAELQNPVTEQERQVLASIDAAHLRIQNANAIVTGHLASIRKVHDAQEEFLRMARLDGGRQRTITFVTTVSDELAGALEQANEVEADIEALPERIKEIMAKINPVGASRTATPEPGASHER